MLNNCCWSTRRLGMAAGYRTVHVVIVVCPPTAAEADDQQQSLFHHALRPRYAPCVHAANVCRSLPGSPLTLYLHCEHWSGRSYLAQCTDGACGNIDVSSCTYALLSPGDCSANSDGSASVRWGCPILSY